jgi:hypothetical protein
MRFLRLLVRPRLLVVYVFALLSLGAMLAIDSLAPSASLPSTATPFPVPLVPVSDAPFGLSFVMPTTWPSPVLIEGTTVVLSPTGSTDISATAGPFMVLIPDALTVFRARLAFRDDHADPQQQLDALTESLNRTGARFERAAAYPNSKFPAAITHGYERGNELTIVLLNMGEKGWLYVGAQARRGEFDHYEIAVFQPVTNSLTFR